MSKWGKDTGHVETAVTIKRHGQSDKTILELVRELKHSNDD